MALDAQSGDVGADSRSHSPRVRMLMPQTGKEETAAASTMEEDTAPIASTSKMAYSPLHSSDMAPLASSASHDQASTSHAYDHQDINPSLHNHPTMQRPSSTTASSIPTSSSPSIKGKERAIDTVEPAEASAKQSRQSMIAALLPDPFQSSEMERLRVENEHLKKQLDVLAKKNHALNNTIKHDRVSGLRPDSSSSNSLQLEQVNRMLRTSEAQRKRLAKELRYLRSYLLSSVEPYRLPTPDSDSNEEMAIDSDSSDDLIREERSRAENGGVPRKRRRRRSLYDASRHADEQKRKQTMGDAETEHLLLASARMNRLRKVVHLHPNSELSHLPQAKRSRISFPFRTGDVFEQTERYNTREGDPNAQQSPLPPLPPAWRLQEGDEEDLSPQLPSSSASPSRPPIPPSAVLGSPIRTTRVKLEHESPRVTLSNAASIFQSSAAGAAAAGPGASIHPVAPAMQPSTSTTSSGKGERKIGRPLGSPNKTKLVSINHTAAAKRKTKQGSVLPGSNGGRAGGKGRAAGPSAPPFNDTRGGSQTQDPSATVDELLLAAQSLYGNEADADMQIDYEGRGEEWPEDAMQDTASVGWRSPDKRRHTCPSPPKAVPWPPATPSSLQEPDMTRFPNQMPVPSASGLPATPARPRTNSTGSSLFPPQTPNTIARNERSALDVLAEEAASASKGPAAISTSRNLDALSGSARNLAHEMEMAGRSPRISTGLEAGEHVNAYGAYQYTLPDSAQDPRHFLGAAFSPHLQQQNTSDPVEEEQETSYGGPMTIAEQLAQGVDVSHPLIDLEDIQAGMTPAAALAKRSRSAYVKWTLEEDELLVRGVAEYGTKWEAVARMIPSRSYHQCRQRWLRGLKSGDALPPSMQHLKPKIDAAVQAYEQARPGGVKKVES